MEYGKSTIDLVTEDDGTLCPKCNFPLNIIKSRLEFINDHTPDLQTEAYRCLDMACVNKECSNYVGVYLSNPITIVKTIRHREV